MNKSKSEEKENETIKVPKRDDNFRETLSNWGWWCQSEAGKHPSVQTQTGVLSETPSQKQNKQKKRKQTTTTKRKTISNFLERTQSEENMQMLE